MFIHLQDALLTCLATGIALTNLSNNRTELTRMIKRLDNYVYCAFFTLTGASLELDIMIHAFAIACVLVVSRVVALFIGSYYGGMIAGESKEDSKYAGFCYITQAGVTLGLAKEVHLNFPGWGGYFSTMIIATVVLNQLMGPPLMRWALRQVGDAMRGNSPNAEKVIVVGINKNHTRVLDSLVMMQWEIIEAQIGIDQRNGQLVSATASSSGSRGGEIREGGFALLDPVDETNEKNEDEEDDNDDDEEIVIPLSGGGDDDERSGDAKGGGGDADDATEREGVSAGETKNQSKASDSVGGEKNDAAAAGGGGGSSSKDDDSTGLSDERHSSAVAEEEEPIVNAADANQRNDNNNNNNNNNNNDSTFTSRTLGATNVWNGFMSKTNVDSLTSDPVEIQKYISWLLVSNEPVNVVVILLKEPAEIAQAIQSFALASTALGRTEILEIIIPVEDRNPKEVRALVNVVAINFGPDAADAVDVILIEKDDRIPMILDMNVRHIRHRMKRERFGKQLFLPRAYDYHGGDQSEQQHFKIHVRGSAAGGDNDSSVDADTGDVELTEMQQLRVSGAAI